MLVVVALLAAVGAGLSPVPPPADAVDPWWVTPQTHEFPATAVGDTASVIVKITNLGRVPASPVIADLGADDAEHFMATRECGSERLPPGAGCTIRYSFRPSAVDVYPAEVNLSVDGIRHPISFTGRGLFPLIFSTTSIVFAATPIGVTAEAEVELTNISRVPQSLGQLAGGAPRDQGDFGMRTRESGVLPAGGSCRLVYTFHPSRVGVLTTSTTLATDGVSTALTLTGRGAGSVSTAYSGSATTGMTPGLAPLIAGEDTAVSATDPAPGPAPQTVGYSSPVMPAPGLDTWKAIENPIELAAILGCALGIGLLFRRRRPTKGPPTAG